MTRQGEYHQPAARYRYKALARPCVMLERRSLWRPQAMDQKYHQNICTRLLTTYHRSALDDRRDGRLVFIPILVAETADTCAPSYGARAGGEGEVVEAVRAALCTFVCSRRRIWRRRNGTSLYRSYRRVCRRRTAEFEIVVPVFWTTRNGCLSNTIK